MGRRVGSPVSGTMSCRFGDVLIRDSTSIRTPPRVQISVRGGQNWGTLLVIALLVGRGEEERLAYAQRPSGDNPVRTAVRFPMKLTIHIGTAEGPLEATTENISANGLLFVSDRLPDVDSKIEFTINMPSSIMGSDKDLTIHCFGRVVRHQHHGDEKKAAAVIDEYYLKA